ncbi:MAG: hypothetical protein KatS3mg021_2846 [Fimbriimonadales bacterium]|nr:MAG: hypothetical protein KatS3mg021_2846 [Fimbriimonadales bacterium]
MFRTGNPLWYLLLKRQRNRPRFPLIQLQLQQGHQPLIGRHSHLKPAFLEGTLYQRCFGIVLPLLNDLSPDGLRHQNLLMKLLQQVQTPYFSEMNERAMHY